MVHDLGRLNDVDDDASGRTDIMEHIQNTDKPRYNIESGWDKMELNKKLSGSAPFDKV